MLPTAENSRDPPVPHTCGVSRLWGVQKVPVAFNRWIQSRRLRGKDSAYRSGRLADSFKKKNPDASAATREAEEDWS